MKFAVSSSHLYERLSSVSRVINTKNTLPILNYFLFSIQGKELSITASDMETTLITSMELEEVEGEGKVAILAKNLIDILREFADQPLTITIDTASFSVVITSAQGKFSFIGQSGEEYPKMHELDADNTVSFVAPASVLLDGISSTVFATADDELRPVMNGICFDITTEDLTLVGTDAHKLARFKTTAIKGEKDAMFVLPKKPASLLKSILVKETEPVNVSFDTKNSIFTLSNYKMVCRQIDARYPNYNAVIPKSGPTKIIVDRLALLSGVKRVSVCTNQASSLIRFAISDNQIYLSGQDIDFSISGEEYIPCQFQGEAMEIGFKASFIIELLSNINASDVEFTLIDRTRPGIFTPAEQDDNKNILMLLMPMMLND